MFKTFQVAILEKYLCTVLIFLFSACLFPGLKSHDIYNNLQVRVDWRKYFYFHTYNLSAVIQHCDEKFNFLPLSRFSFNGRV